jgi:predicted O-methyltransferase YrrM
MSKLTVFFQILTKSVFKPKLVKDLVEERKQSNEDEKHKNHHYKYDFHSIEEFLKIIFPNYDFKKYEHEINDLEIEVKKFFTELETQKYPSKKKPYPTSYSINSDSRRLLYYLCRILKPKIIVETGVAYGISSAYILKALQKNDFGTLYSIDSVFRPWQTEKMIGSVIPKNLRDRWNLVIGKSADELQNLFNGVGKTDIFIHDSSHTYRNMMFEFNIALEKMNENGIIISDDILGNDAFYDFTNKNNLKNHIIEVDENVGLGIINKI